MVEKREHAVYEQVMATIKSEHVSFVRLDFTDVVGIAKSVVIPIDQFAHCVRHGRWFDGSALENIARIVESDMYLYPDLATFIVLPGQRDTHENVLARVICDIRMPDGERFDGDPRAALSRALTMAQEMGFMYEVAPELEFFLVRLDGDSPVLLNDSGSYFDLSTNDTTAIRNEMVQTLKSMGMKIEASHHEVAPGQHEIDFASGDALHMADNLMTAKYIIKEIALRHGLYATFLPKPFYKINGTGLHIHQHLLHKDSGKNAFADDHGEYGLSEVGRGFIAGQLTHARSICAVLAPLVNSYKRLVRGYEAPVYVNWGRVNRQALIRIPRPDTDLQASMRIELRCTDPSCNPHLALAVMLRTGLDGIHHKLALPPAMDENIFLQEESERSRTRASLLPATLGEALDRMREDPLIRDILGETIYEGFLDAKEIEWTEYCQQVHAWEINRYLPII